MSTSTASLNYLWASLIIEELYRHGISQFCLSPGSRCTPLTAAVANHPDLIRTIHFDERGTAFFALGLARALNQPAVLISTSGTAVANYFPAVIEAAVDCVPLIVITADRPPELRETGANQTIDQVKVFGDYVRWHFDMPCPTPEISLETILTTIDQVVHRASHSPPGPVHLNCMYRDPFLPNPLPPLNDFINTQISSRTSHDLAKTRTNAISRWLKADQPYTHYPNSKMTLCANDIQRIAAMVASKANGMLIVGRLHSVQERSALLHLIQTLKWPVYADVTSGLRSGYPETNVIHHFDLLLRHPQVQELYSPDVVLQFGEKITSKHVYKYLKSLPIDHYVIIANTPDRINPEHIAGFQLETDISLFCQQLTDIISALEHPESLPALKTYSRTVDSIVDRIIEADNSLTEPAVARLISKNISRNSALFIASSMPIRNLNLFAAATGQPVHVAANRGASGIDGTVATAAGFAKGHQQVTTLLIGDLALLHDLNSLALIHSADIRVILVIINNHGGGIFSFLPIAKNKAIFEKYFGTPHKFTFNNAAEMFGLSYRNPPDRIHFTQDYKTALASNKSTLIEVVTDRQQNVDYYERIISRINSEILIESTLCQE